MPEPKVDNSPKKDIKISPVENIQAKLEAKNLYDRQHQTWETTKRIAEAAGSEIPAEPVASKEAVRGKVLTETLNKAKFDGDAIFSGGSAEKVNARFEKILAKINENPDEESKIMQVAGIIDGIGDHLYPQKYDHVSAALNTAPEAMSFSRILENFSPRLFSNSIESLKSDAAQNVLKHLSSELSSASSVKKEEYKFDAEVGKGMKALDILSNATIEKNLNPTPEQIKTAFNFGKNISVDDINKACKDLFDNLRTTQGVDSRVNEGTLSPEGFIRSVENIPLILSKIAQQKPEVAEDIKGKLMGYNRLLAGKRPKLDNSGAYDYKTRVDSYLRITQKITQSIVNFYNPETVNIYTDVLQKAAENPFDREFQELFRNCSLDTYDSKPNPLKVHFNKYLKYSDAAKEEARKQQQIKDDQEKINKQNLLVQEKQKQKQLVQKYSESQEIQANIYPLCQSKNEQLPITLDNVRKNLDNLKINRPDLDDVADFAKSIADKFAKIINDNPSLITETDNEISRHKKGLFGNKYIVNHQFGFSLNQDIYDKLLQKSQNQASENPTVDNYATLEALNLISSKRSKIKRGYQTEE